MEWGEVVPDNTNAIMITCMTSQLEDALEAGDITRIDAIERIQLAVEELHNIGFARCDIVLGNGLVHNGMAFLDDLEYLIPVNKAAPINTCWTSAAHLGLSASMLDTLLMSAFTLEVMRA